MCGVSYLRHGSTCSMFIVKFLAKSLGSLEGQGQEVSGDSVAGWSVPHGSCLASSGPGLDEAPVRRPACSGHTETLMCVGG